MTSRAEKRRRKRTVIVAKGGRPRKQGVDRYADGSIIRDQREPHDPDPMATARAQPHRTALAELLFAKNPPKLGVELERLAGSSLGRLYLCRVIQRHHFDAGSRYAENMARDRAILGLPPVSVQAMRYGDAPVGVNRADVTSEKAQEASERILKARVALAEAGDQWFGDVCRPALVVRQITLEDQDESTMGEREIGALRVGLNALARLYQIGIEQARLIAA